MQWRDVIIQTVWDYAGASDDRSEATGGAIVSRLLDMPAEARIAFARELLAGTGRVVAVVEQTIVGKPHSMRILRTWLVEDKP